jgi:hypothetical protein
LEERLATLDDATAHELIGRLSRAVATLARNGVLTRDEIGAFFLAAVDRVGR